MSGVLVLPVILHRHIVDVRVLVSEAIRESPLFKNVAQNNPWKITHHGFAGTLKNGSFMFVYQKLLPSSVYIHKKSCSMSSFWRHSKHLYRTSREYIYRSKGLKWMLSTLYWLPLGIMFDQHLYTIKYVSGRSMQVRIL
jgi:hypothetical protein